MGIVAAGGLAMLGLLTLLVGASRGAPAPSGSADLSLTKSDSPDPVATGGALAYSILVANAGPDAATNVIVTDNLPKGVSFVSATSTQGSCSAKGKKNGQTLTCDLAWVHPAQDVTVVGPVTDCPLTVICRPGGAVSRVMATLFGWKSRTTVVETPPESVAVRLMRRKLLAAAARSSGPGAVKVIPVPVTGPRNGWVCWSCTRTIVQLSRDGASVPSCASVAEPFS